MVFKADKCKVVHFGKKNSQFSYIMGGHAHGVVLESVEQEKDVGVMISNDLKLSLQCSTAAKKG